MADFQTSLSRLVRDDEGGYTVDEGGETYEGVSRKAWPEWSGWIILDRLPAGTLRQGVIVQGIPALDQAVANFYKQNFWHFEAVADQELADKIFSVIVNLDYAGVRLIQLALQKTQEGPIVCDGKLGPQTQAGIVQSEPKRLLHAIRFFQVKHYLEADSARPDELNGLLWRATE